MQKVLAKESMKFLKLVAVGLLLIIVLILAGEKLSGIESLILTLLPYLLYQIYSAIQSAKKRKRK
jgi:ABC-type antimicrobial peptide transport system permease subunit